MANKIILSGSHTMTKSTIIVILTALLNACSTSAIKEKINKVGDVAGQTAGEFIEGASKGIKKAFDVQITLPMGLKERGIEFGKATVTSDSLGTDNMLLLYVIFNKDFEGKLTAKVYDEQSREMGRSSVNLSGKKDEARYAEFHFDKRTNIDSKNKLTIE
jgi:hypothetical protein